MGDLNFVWLGPALWALLGLLGVVMWNRHRKHAYLLGFAAAWLCAGVASTGAWFMDVYHVGVPGLVGTFAWLAAVITAQATAQRFGRCIHMPTVAVVTVLMLLGWVYWAYLQPSALALHGLLVLGLALLLGHVLLAIWRVALRHSRERNLLVIYGVVCLLLGLSPWLPIDDIWAQPMLWLPVGAAVFSAAVVACVWAESPRHLRSKNDRDVLTGLMSRQAFEQSCGARPAEQHIRFMVLCDVDDFQRVNQQFGKTVGDEVLSQFALLLQTSVRTGDVVARMGGEEFALALRHIGSDHAHALVQRIVTAMAQQHWASKLNPALTASFGVAVVREDDSLNVVLHRADVLLCQAKDAGGHRIAMDEVVAEPQR